MADLTGQTPAATYKGLLQVNDYTNGVAGNTGSNALAIQDGAGNATALAISTDNVGIGTTSPAATAKLDVNGRINAESLLITANSSIGLGIQNTDNTNSAYIKNIGSSNETLLSIDDKVYVKEDGNVGIGTTSPAAKLDVTGDAFVRNLDNRGVYTETFSRDEAPDFFIQNQQTDTNTGSTKILLRNAGTSGASDATIAVVNKSSAEGALAFCLRHSADNTNISEKMRIDSDGNVGIGTTSFGATAAGVLAMKNGTAPTSSPADMVQLYAEDVTASSELRVRDEAGNVTTLSPHAKDAPDSLYDQGKGVDEMHRVANHYLGTITFTNVDRRNDLLQKQLNGEELPVDRTFKVTETFTEYNARTGSDLQVEDWDANQQAMFDEQEEKVVARQAEIDAWDNEEEEAPAPLESYVKKPKPEWLS